MCVEQREACCSPLYFNAKRKLEVSGCILKCLIKINLQGLSCRESEI